MNDSSAPIPQAREARFDEDAALVLRAQKGGPAGRRAFNELIKAYQQRTIRQLLYLLGSEADAEDVAQETFARAYTKLSSLSEPKTFSAWLRRISLNLAFNKRRSRKTNPVDLSVAEPEDKIGRREPRVLKRDAISKALMRLNYHAREIMVLYYVEEISLGEIASLLNLGQSAAKMRLARAREEFQRIYGRRES